MEVKFLSTPEAAQALQISYTYLLSLLSVGKISPKPDMHNGRYMWSPADLDRLSQLVHKTSFQQYLETVQTSPEVQCQL